MLPNRDFLRTPIDAAATAARYARDFKLASRLTTVGINPYKGGTPITLVDLASEGSLSEPQGLEFRHSKIFNSHAAVVAYGLHCDIEAFEQERNPTNVVHIVLRPPIGLRSKDEERLLLDDEGRCAISDLRHSQKAFNHLVQRAIAELERKALIEPLFVARHLLPFDGGARFDLHSHVVALMADGADGEAHGYLADLFGSARVWTSSIMEPGEVRNFSGTANYPIWRLANQDWSAVEDVNLKEFFEQCSKLRSTDALGPFRRFRSPDSSTSQVTIEDDRDQRDDEGQVGDEGGLAEAGPSGDGSSDTNIETAGVDQGRDSRSCTTIDISGYRTEDPNRVPVLLGYHFAWIGLTRRFVARVANYTSFADLQERYYLDEGIAFARHHVEQTHSYLFKPVKPKIDSSAPVSAQRQQMAASESVPMATPNMAAGPQNAVNGSSPVATPETSAAGPQHTANSGCPVAASEISAAGPQHAANSGSPVATPETPAAGPQQAANSGSPVATPETPAAGPQQAANSGSPVATPETSAAGPHHAANSGSPVATPETSAAGPHHAANSGCPVAASETPAAGPQHAANSGSPVATPETSAAGPQHAANSGSPVAASETSATGPQHAANSGSPMATPETSAAGPQHAANGGNLAAPPPRMQNVDIGDRETAHPRNSGRVASYSTKPKSASSAFPLSCRSERHPSPSASSPPLPELSFELIVRGESGPATATLRVSLPWEALQRQITA